MRQHQIYALPRAAQRVMPQPLGFHQTGGRPGLSQAFSFNLQDDIVGAVVDD